MEPFFNQQVKELYDDAYKIINGFLKQKRQTAAAMLQIPAEFKAEFFRLVDNVNASLLADNDNFYGYFLFQLSREIRFDISSPTAVTFQRAKYVLYFNPIIFLTLTLQQMETTIKHEILHICSMHLIRARELKTRYKPVALNMAMDVVVNAYLDYLPPYATTLEWVNLNYSLKLLPFESFEYYAENIQNALDLLEVVEGDSEADSPDEESIETEYDPATTHDIWQDSSELDEQTLREFTEKVMDAAQKGEVPYYLAGLIAAMKNSKAALPWNLYLQRLMGAVVGNPKKTITRRNRRQPDRLDIRGELRSHKAKLVVALDISGSISDEEFLQAIQEVFNIVKNYRHEIEIVECDNEIRRVYKVKSAKDVKERFHIRGGTRFSPVFEYANAQKIDLLVYFTDGKGEDRLQSIPKGYNTLWVISGRGDKLSLNEAYGAVKKLNPVASKEHILDINDVEQGGYSMNNHEKIHI
jgi:predicted metal-dependent peptidase